MHSRKIIRDFVGIAGSQYLVRMLLVARGIVAARMLGPAAFGRWNALALVMDYGIMAQFGTLQGLDQTVPPRIVQGDPAALVRVKRAGLFNVLVTGILFIAATGLWLWRSTGDLRGYWGLTGLSLAGLAALLTNYSNVHNSVMRSHGDMTSVSGWTMLQGLLGAVLGVAFLPWIGPWSLLWGWLAGTVVALVFLRVRAGDRVPYLPAASADVRLLFTIGFPMFVYVGLSFVMRSLDRLVILRFLGTESLGFYTLAVMAINLLMYLPDSLAYVLYPRILARYHEAGQDPDVVRDPIERALRVVSVLLPLFCALAYLAADDAVLWLLPKYRGGVPALRILCFGAAALGLGSLSSVVMMTLRRQKVLVPVSLGTTVLGALLMIGAVRLGFGIRGVAWATLATYAIHSAVMLWFALGGLHEQATRRLGYLVRLFAPLVAAIGLAWMCNTFLPWSSDTGLLALARLVMGLMLFVAGYLAFAAPLMRGVGLSQLASEFRLPGLARLRRPFGG